jgi:glutamate synthase domain-containing protein 2
MLQTKLRELCGGKPVGFKLCVGHRWEFLAMCKAMRETGIHPDFIVVDGGEGGTGAAPVEFSNHVGTPLRAGLTFVQNALVGANLREHIKLGASGKIISAFDIIGAMALGADWCNSARGFMFAVGCIQSRSCHTNRCPVGVATQDPHRQRALVVPQKAERVHQFHRNTVEALSEIVAAAGLNHSSEIQPRHFYIRLGGPVTMAADRGAVWLEPGSLLDGSAPEDYRDYWAKAGANSFSATE